MTGRERLAQRRMCETVEFEHGGSVFTATLGYYLDPTGVCRLGEVFLNSGKVGSAMDVATRDSAVAVSFALQHGCDVETMRAAFTRDAAGAAEGVLGRLLDLICESEGA